VDGDVPDVQLRLILEPLPHPAYVWRRQGADFVLAAYNHAADRITRGGVAAVVGRSISDVFGDRPDVLRDMDECWASRGVIHRESVFLLRSIGESRMLSVTYAWAPPDLVIVHTHDLTQLRQLEYSLTQAQKMEAIGRLAGGIAHDFNNLLTVILGYGELLTARDDVPAEVLQDAQEIVKAARSASSLTRQLLTFSRRSMLEPKIVSLNDVVGQVDSLLKRLLGEDITLDVQLAPGLCRVRADPGHLEQVVMNLAVNARDAMPRGGRLSIHTSNVEVDEDDALQDPGMRVGLHAMVTVEDTGAGMTEEVKARLFEPFFTTKPLGEGTGLGLATVYGAVKQSGGTVRVESELGRGSRFSVLLPAAQPE
jgi:signal transduction histidine kinase